MPGAPGVGHVNANGGGGRNAFGRDFAAAGLRWTTALCQQDRWDDVHAAPGSVHEGLKVGWRLDAEGWPDAAGGAADGLLKVQAGQEWLLLSLPAASPENKGKRGSMRA